MRIGKILRTIALLITVIFSSTTIASSAPVMPSFKELPATLSIKKGSPIFDFAPRMMADVNGTSGIVSDINKMILSMPQDEQKQAVQEAVKLFQKSPDGISPRLKALIRAKAPQHLREEIAYSEVSLDETGTQLVLTVNEEKMVHGLSSELPEKAAKTDETNIPKMGIDIKSEKGFLRIDFILLSLALGILTHSIVKAIPGNQYLNSGIIFSGLVIVFRGIWKSAETIKSAFNDDEIKELLYDFLLRPILLGSLTLVFMTAFYFSASLVFGINVSLPLMLAATVFCCLLSIWTVDKVKVLVSKLLYSKRNRNKKGKLKTLATLVFDKVIAGHIAYKEFRHRYRDEFAYGVVAFLINGMLLGVIAAVISGLPVTKAWGTGGTILLYFVSFPVTAIFAWMMYKAHHRTHKAFGDMYRWGQALFTAGSSLFLAYQVRKIIFNLLTPEQVNSLGFALEVAIPIYFFMFIASIYYAFNAVYAVVAKNIYSIYDKYVYSKVVRFSDFIFFNSSKNSRNLFVGAGIFFASFGIYFVNIAGVVIGVSMIGLGIVDVVRKFVNEGYSFKYLPINSQVKKLVSGEESYSEIRKSVELNPLRSVDKWEREFLEKAANSLYMFHSYDACKELVQAAIRFGIKSDGGGKTKNVIFAGYLHSDEDTFETAKSYLDNNLCTGEFSDDVLLEFFNFVQKYEGWEFSTSDTLTRRFDNMFITYADYFSPRAAGKLTDHSKSEKLAMQISGELESTSIFNIIDYCYKWGVDSELLEAVEKRRYVSPQYKERVLEMLSKIADKQTSVDEKTEELAAKRKFDRKMREFIRKEDGFSVVLLVGLVLLGIVITALPLLVLAVHWSWIISDLDHLLLSSACLIHYGFGAILLYKLSCFLKEKISNKKVIYSAPVRYGNSPEKSTQWMVKNNKNGGYDFLIFEAFNSNEKKVHEIAKKYLYENMTDERFYKLVTIHGMDTDCMRDLFDNVFDELKFDYRNWRNEGENIRKDMDAAEKVKSFSYALIYIYEFGITPELIKKVKFFNDEELKIFNRIAEKLKEKYPAAKQFLESQVKKDGSGEVVEEKSLFAVKPENIKFNADKDALAKFAEQVKDLLGVESFPTVYLSERIDSLGKVAKDENEEMAIYISPVAVENKIACLATLIHEYVHILVNDKYPGLNKNERQVVAAVIEKMFVLRLCEDAQYQKEVLGENDENVSVQSIIGFLTDSQDKELINAPLVNYLNRTAHAEGTAAQRHIKVISELVSMTANEDGEVNAAKVEDVVSKVAGDVFGSDDYNDFYTKMRNAQLDAFQQGVYENVKENIELKRAVLIDKKDNSDDYLKLANELLDDERRVFVREVDGIKELTRNGERTLEFADSSNLDSALSSIKNDLSDKGEFEFCVISEDERELKSIDDEKVLLFSTAIAEKVIGDKVSGAVPFEALVLPLILTFERETLDSSSGIGKLFDKKGSIYELNAAAISEFADMISDSYEVVIKAISSAVKEAINQRQVRIAA